MGVVPAALLGSGVAFGLAAGAAFAAARALNTRVSRDTANNPRLINWEWARAIAVRGARDSQSDELQPVLDPGAKAAAQSE